MAALLTACLGDRDELLDTEIGRARPRPVRAGKAGGRLGEGAVAAVVAAEHGERDEDLGRVGHAGAGAVVADAARLGDKLVQGGGRGGGEFRHASRFPRLAGKSQETFSGTRSATVPTCRGATHSQGRSPARSRRSATAGRCCSSASCCSLPRATSSWSGRCLASLPTCW